MGTVSPDFLSTKDTKESRKLQMDAVLELLAEPEVLR
jgi:hypothetical protein